MQKQLKSKVLNELYILEDYFEYNKTEQGKRLGMLIDELQK